MTVSDELDRRLYDLVGRFEEGRLQLNTKYQRASCYDRGFGTPYSSDKYFVTSSSSPRSPCSYDSGTHSVASDEGIELTSGSGSNTRLPKYGDELQRLIELQRIEDQSPGAYGSDSDEFLNRKLSEERVAFDDFDEKSDTFDDSVKEHDVPSNGIPKRHRFYKARPGDQNVVDKGKKDIDEMFPKNVTFQKPHVPNFWNKGSNDKTGFKGAFADVSSPNYHNLQYENLRKTQAMHSNKKYEEIPVYKMDKCKGYEPFFRHVEDVRKDDTNMEKFYKNAHELDDDIVVIDHDDPKSYRNWTDFGLETKMVDRLSIAHYVSPRNVQSAVIPLVIANNNVLCKAENAAGKTMAFIVPILDQLLKAKEKGEYVTSTTPKPFAVVIAPTRELAIQIKEQFDKFAKSFLFHVALCVGEFAVNRNVDHCRNMEIVVGTPGRLAHFVRDNQIAFDLSKTEYIVLDEADKLLEKGPNSFILDLNTIFEAVRFECKQLYFYATDTDSIMDWVNDQGVPIVTVHNKKKMLVSRAEFKPVYIKKEFIRTFFIREYIKRNCLAGDVEKKVLVFCESKEEAYKMACVTADKDFNSVSLSADMNQACRDKIMKSLRANNGEQLIVFCSNLAARGLDIPSLDHVVILNIEEKDFEHRFGRTGRLRTGHVHVVIHEQYSNVSISRLITALESIKYKIPSEIYDLEKGKRSAVEFKEGI